MLYKKFAIYIQALTLRLRLIDRYEVTISIANWTRVQLIAATHTARLMTTWSSNTIHILLIADDALTIIIVFTK